MDLYLIVANDGDSWYSLLEQDVWDAVELWADGYYDVFRISAGTFEGGTLHGQPHIKPLRLISTESETAHKERELVWEEVQEAKEVKADGTD